MPPLIDSADDCRHSGIEHLGNDHDARFFRCQGCAQVFVVQGGFTLAIPAVQPQPHPPFERDPGPDAELPRVAGRSMSE